ncbi:MAG: tRNA uridine-5-carboxymethylaminomethyl(34) synthesis GTPase MnmE, partial [bacterium]
TRDEIEDEGIRRALLAAENADLVLWVEDATAPFSEETIPKPGQITLKVLNKCDLIPGVMREGYIPVSAKTGQGLPELKEHLWQKAVGGVNLDKVGISRERHFQALERSLQSLGRAENLILSQAAVELVAEELRESLDALGEITGRHRTAHLLETIFSQFCIGK